MRIIRSRITVAWPLALLAWLKAVPAALAQSLGAQLKPLVDFAVTSQQPIPGYQTFKAEARASLRVYYPRERFRSEGPQQLRSGRDSARLRCCRGSARGTISRQVGKISTNRTMVPLNCRRRGGDDSGYGNLGVCPRVVRRLGQEL